MVVGRTSGTGRLDLCNIFIFHDGGVEGVVRKTLSTS